MSDALNPYSAIKTKKKNGGTYKGMGRKILVILRVDRGGDLWCRRSKFFRRKKPSNHSSHTLIGKETAEEGESCLKTYCRSLEDNLCVHVGNVHYNKTGKPKNRRSTGVLEGKKRELR